MLVHFRPATVITESLPPRCSTSNTDNPPSYNEIFLTEGGITPSAPSSSLQATSTTDELYALLKGMGLTDSWNAYTEANGIGNTNNDEGVNCYRVASWNLNRFTMAKSLHPGFREAICLTILRNRIDVIAFQEVSDVEAANSVSSSDDQHLFSVLTKPYSNKLFDMCSPVSTHASVNAIVKQDSSSINEFSIRCVC